MGLVAMGNLRDCLWELVSVPLRLPDLTWVVQLQVGDHTAGVEDSPRALQMMDTAGVGQGRGCLVQCHIANTLLTLTDTPHC